jgi:DNA-binding transcriptional ArsR family regulator
VITGYLDFFRAEHHVVHFFHNVLKDPVITKIVLRRRTNDYVHWIEAYARKRKIPLIWVPRDAKGKPLSHEEVVAPALQRARRAQRFGVYYILMSKERGRSFRSIQLRHATQDPNYRMIRPEFLHYRHYYFHIHDPVLGNMVLRVASFIPFTVCAYLNGHEFIARRLQAQKLSCQQQDNAFTAIEDPKALQRAANALSAKIIRRRLNYWAFTLGPKFSANERLACKGLARSWSIQQLEYCWNVVFKRHWPIRHIFERSCELSLYSFTADRISQIFGHRISRHFHGKLQTVLENIEQGRHVFRAYWKNGFLRQYEKWRTYLRMELLSNCLPDLNLRKGLDGLDQIRKTCHGILDRFAANQTTNLNVHGQFDLVARLAKPVQLKKSKIAGIRLDQVRMMRLLQVFLGRGAGSLGGWSAKELRSAILETFELRANQYSLSAIRYDLRKLRAHGLIERLPHTHRYRLTAKGQRVAILMTLLRKRLYGPLAASAFVHKPAAQPLPPTPIEKAYRKADRAFQEVIDLMAA